MTLVSIIACPHCGYTAAEQMPTNACQVLYDCKGCDDRADDPQPKLLSKDEGRIVVNIALNGTSMGQTGSYGSN